MKVERPRARSSAAPTRENSRSTTPIRARAPARSCRSAPARDQRVLAQEGRLAGHVRAGEQPDRAGALRRPGGDRSQSLAMNGWPSRFSACSTTGCRPPSIDEASERRPRAAHNCRSTASCASAVATSSSAKRLRRGAQDRRWPRGDHRASRSKIFQLEPERAVGGVGDLGFELAELGGGEADLAGQRLAMDEGRVQRRRHQLVAVLRRHLDEIAEHVVVPDLQALDAGLVGVARLQRGDDAARGVAQARASSSAAHSLRARSRRRA
jgi:hypothetical protein